MPIPADIHPGKLLAILCGIRFDRALDPFDFERLTQIASGIFEIPPLEFTRIGDNLSALASRFASLESIEDIYANVDGLTRVAEPELAKLWSTAHRYLTPEREQDFVEWLQRRVTVPLNVALPLAFYALCRLDPSEAASDPLLLEAREGMRTLLSALKRLDPAAFRSSARQMFDERTGAGTSPLAYEQQAVVRTLRRMMSADRSLHVDGPRRALLDVLAAWSSAAETMLPVFGRFVLRIVQPAGPEPLTNEAIFDEVRGLCERHAFVLPFTPKLYRIRDAIVHERFSEGEQEITFYDGRSRVIASLPLLDAIYTAQRDICAAAVFPPAVLSTEVEHDNLVGKFDVLWERAQACIPDLADRVRDCGEPWIPSNWELVDISPKEADTWNPTPHESLSRMLTSLFSDQELRIFLGCFPAGPDLLVELPGAGATPAHLAAETVQLLERRRLTPLLFRRLMRSFPRRQAEIKEIQRLFGPWRASPVSSG